MEQVLNFEEVDQTQEGSSSISTSSTGDFYGRGGRRLSPDMLDQMRLQLSTLIIDELIPGIDEELRRSGAHLAGSTGRSSIIDNGGGNTYNVVQTKVKYFEKAVHYLDQMVVGEEIGNVEIVKKRLIMDAGIAFWKAGLFRKGY